VTNALSEFMEVEVARGRRLWRQRYARGMPTTPLEDLGEVMNRRGTTVRFRPDPQIFGAGARLDPARMFRMARSKAYLFGGVEIRWHCDAALAAAAEVPAEAVFRFPGGLADYLAEQLAGETRVADQIFAGR